MRTEPRTGSRTEVATDEPLAGIEAGLDALDAPRILRPPRTRQLTTKALPPIFAACLLLAGWQVAFALRVAAPNKLPSPALVLDALNSSWRDGSLGRALRVSLEHGAIGYLVSVAIATPIGLVIARVSFVRAAIKPLVSGLQTLPSVAWVIPGVLWFHGSAGAIYFVVLMGAIPAIALGLVSGIDQVPQLYLRVGKVLGASGFSGTWHVLLPAALPGYLAGLKQGWAFSWRALMAAELIVHDPRLFGLGQFLNEGRLRSDISLECAAVLTILAVGIAVDVLLFSPVERFVLRRRGLLAT